MQASKLFDNMNTTMYGFADIDDYVDQVVHSITYKVSGANMVVAGLMSDAQDLLVVGDKERARQTLNIAKHILFLVMDGRLVGTVERA